MSTLESMFRAVQIIEQCLREPITVQEIAEAIGYSLFHFSRTFSRVVGHSPYDYLIRRRLSVSVDDVCLSQKRIIDIAFDFQFGSPETYSRAFRRMFGVLPNEVRKGQAVGRERIERPATLAYIRHINRGDYLKPVYVDRGAVHLVGIAARAQGQPDLVGELWEPLNRVLGSVTEGSRPRQLTAVAYRVPGPLEERFYFLGVEVESLEAMPLEMVGKVVPPSKYARFIHKGRARDIWMTLDYIYQTWLPKSGNVVAAPIEVFVYAKDDGGPDCPDSETEVLIPIE